MLRIIITVKNYDYCINIRKLVKTNTKGVILLKIKKVLVYFISFLSISLMFSVCYYLSFKNALKQFNANAVERNKELILSLEQNGLIIGNEGNQYTENEIENNDPDTTIGTDDSVEVDSVTEVITPTTEYRLQVYDIKYGTMTEEVKETSPSYLVGLNRVEVIEYLYDYMQDLSLSEFEKGLTNFELIRFSEDEVTIRKTYNIDKVENKFYLTTQNDYIVIYYGDAKTVYEYTNISIANLTQFEKMQLENGIYAKDLNELYALLENYTS